MVLTERIIHALKFYEKDGNPIGREGLKILRAKKWKVWCNGEYDDKKVSFFLD
jgi:hypothetical protein